MFAALVFEAGREPLRYQDLPEMLAGWVRIVGVLGLIGVLFWLVFVLLGLVRLEWKRISAWHIQVLSIAVILAGLLYGLGAITGSLWMLTAGGVCALAGACLGFLLNLPEMSWRRIGAITRLSFKEALRRRVPYIFAVLLLVFLFANWYVPYKPEAQVRMYVGIVFFALQWLMLVAAAWLGAFSIPTDIKQQTIHTILTKPVERFEVVLGRFLGFSALLSVILLVMAGLSLIYVVRNVDPAAADESLRARDPVYGELKFEGVPGRSDKPGAAESVGREWEYRSYIAGPLGGKTHTAIWSFPTLPASLASRPTVRCEFYFDVYRLHVGKEGRGLTCNFVFTTRNYKKEDLSDIKKKLNATTSSEEKRKVEAELAKDYGYFEFPARDIEDYHTLFINVPGGLFQNALTESSPGQSASRGRQSPEPALQVRVKNNSTAGYVGMARYDLYFLQDDPESGLNALWFGANYFKGMFGLWFLMVLICGLAVALSTYLSGVVAFLIAWMIFMGGMCQDFIKTVAQGTNFGGGPLEALVKITTRHHLAAPLEESTLKQITTGSDAAFRVVVRGLLYVLPDIERFSLTSYVAEGFNIPLSQVLLSLVVLAGYLLPWGILAFYLIKWREIASQT